MKNQVDEIIDFRQFFFQILRNWFFFLLSLIIAFLIAYAYNRYSHPLFHSETSILIQEENTDLVSASDLLYDRGVNKQKSLENKELVLRSFPLIYSTLEELGFDVSYYIVGNIMVAESYHAPIRFVCDDVSLLIGSSFTIDVVDKDNFLLHDNEGNNIGTYVFGEDFNLNNTQVSIIINTEYPFDKNIEIPQTIVKINNLTSLTHSYQRKLKITQTQKESTVINISILELNTQVIIFK